MTVSANGAQHPEIVPQPKEIRWKASSIPLPAGSTAIVIGDKATEPERCAAEALKSAIARRFHVSLPVVKESSNLQAYTTLILLGQRGTCAFADRLSREWNLDIGDKWDGYVICSGESGDRQVILVGGSNARGVIYGQDTLLQLVQSQGDGIAVAGAEVRDWPSIRWRGKPQTSVEIHLNEGIMDWYLRSRFNYIDLRSGVYAFDPGEKLDMELIAKAIGEAHRHGLVVYATVNCGTERTEHDTILAKFGEFIKLGADGLWASFDDKGPGEAPTELLARIIELGRQHGITGDRIAITPPKGSYQMIDSPFTRSMLAVPRMDEALWFFTCVPSAENTKAAQAVGLKSKAGWWHNWPRTPGRSMIGGSVRPVGFLYSSITPKGPQQPYLPVPSLEEGWHQPTYRDLSGSGDWCSAVMQWGGTIWKYEYTYPVMGWWAWDPSRHDWQALRRRIYGLVYGPSRAADAMAFDDCFIKLRNLFVFPIDETEQQVKLPPTLARTQDRPKAVGLARGMESALKRLTTARSEDTFTVKDRMHTHYLDAQRAEVSTAGALVDLQFPEYWWDAHQRSVLSAIYDGNTTKASALISKAADRIMSEAEEVESRLTEAGGLDSYVQYWADRANLDAEGWAKAIGKRPQAFSDAVADLAYQRIGDISKLIKGIDAPPTEFQLIGTTMPTNREYWRGTWLSGRYTANGKEFFAFIHPNKTWTNVGDYVEVEVNVPTAGTKGWRGVAFYINAWVGESLGLETIRGRWLGRRSIKLLYGGKILWQDDVSLLPGDGRWVTVGLPDEIEDLETVNLRLRVEDVLEADNYPTMICISPIRSLAVPR